MGDQPQAIQKIVMGIRNQEKSQILMGVTGSGKTFTMANVIAQVGLPTLILSHNKTLAAQLFSEFKEFFPENAVEYFVSYYDYYQPEAYLPQTNTYIQKDAQMNDEIDKLRHSATRSLLERKDIVLVSSVSCIYGLGSPAVYCELLIKLSVGCVMSRQDLLKKLVDIQYTRNDSDFHRGTFRVRGDRIEIFPVYEEEKSIRVEFFGDIIESIVEMDPLSGILLQKISQVHLYPASHYVTTSEHRKKAIDSIRTELRKRLQELKSLDKHQEAQRLAQRTLFDLEMLEELGYCQGIENYSCHFSSRQSGQAPPTLFDYFPKEWLLIVDESHVTIPQIGGMYRGDRSRKLTLVEHGFRLPSALDNRPLNFEEWENSLFQTLYVSATPGNYELQKTGGRVIEQIIRPTYLLDPQIQIHPAVKQVDHLLSEMKLRIKRQERVLVTTLTKRLAEELTRFYQAQGIRIKYLHSEIETLERIEILRNFRLGVFDVLVGINLLREGLDLPEVSLVAIFDADKEGFLRSERSLLQTMGRAARHIEGTVILYADQMTKSIQQAVLEVDRRRTIQETYNQTYGLRPRSIQKAIRPSMVPLLVKGTEKKIRDEEDGSSLLGSVAEVSDFQTLSMEKLQSLAGEYFTSLEDLPQTLLLIEAAMQHQSKLMQFEKAAGLRDRLKQLKRVCLMLKG